jgi:uncharacterized protein
MRLGIFADSHDHLDNIRRAVEVFNREACELVLFAGDFVSTFALPPLRQLRCRLLACYGDNEGNKPGLQAGIRIVGTLGEPPLCVRTPDGVRIALVHMLRQLREAPGEYDIVVYAHTHKPSVARDEAGVIHINPGETSGWTYGNPTVAILETSPFACRIVPLADVPLPERRARRPLEKSRKNSER